MNDHHGVVELLHWFGTACEPSQALDSEGQPLFDVRTDVQGLTVVIYHRNRLPAVLRVLRDMCGASLADFKLPGGREVVSTSHVNETLTYDLYYFDRQGQLRERKLRVEPAFAKK